MIYLFIALLLLFLSIRIDINGKTEYQEFWYYFVLIFFVLIAGLRYRVGVDTTDETYLFYHDIPVISRVFDNMSLLDYPLWTLLNSFVFTIGGKWFWVQLIQSTFVNVLIFRYFKKHCEYVFTCIFFYYIWLYAAINFEEMKASFAIVLSLYAYDYILSKKYLKGLVLLSIGCLFHFSAILVLPLAFFSFLKLNVFGFVLLAFSFVLGHIIATRFEDYLFLFGFDEFVEGKVQHYSESDRFFNRDQTGKLFYLVWVLPLILYPMASFWIVKMKNKTLEMLKLEPYLLFGLCMVGVYASIIIFYRYINFYIPIFILFVSQAIVDITKDLRSISYGVSFFRSFCICSLFFLNIYFANKERIDKFYPYSSVIDRKVYESKEKKFSTDRVVKKPRYDEY